MFEVVVEIEAVAVLHVLPSRVLVEDPGLAAGQGLKGPPEFSLLCARFRQDNSGYTTETQPPHSHSVVWLLLFTDAGGRANLFHAEIFSLVEHQQHQRLEEGHLQLLLALRG